MAYEYITTDRTSSVSLGSRLEKPVSNLKAKCSNIIAEQILRSTFFRPHFEDELIEYGESLCYEIATRVLDGELLTLKVTLDNGDCGNYELITKTPKEFIKARKRDLSKWEDLHVLSNDPEIVRLAKREIDNINCCLKLNTNSKLQSASKLLRTGFLKLEIEDYFVEQRLNVWDENINFACCTLIPLYIPDLLNLVEGLTIQDHLRNSFEGNKNEVLTSYESDTSPCQREGNSLGVNPRLPVTIKKKKKPKKLERDLEAELLYWLDQKDVMAEQQVSSRGRRTDIWIPGKCFLELKRQKVTGEDVCQAAKYFALYSRQIILVGETLSTRAGEGIAAMNAIAGENALSFVTWSAIYSYLEVFL